MFPAFLIQIVIALVIVGLILWALGQFPIDPTISRIIRVVIIVVVVIWLLYVLMGVVGGGPMYPRLR
jgi:hypothetical protein